MKNPTVPNLPKRAIFYARVSSEGQVDNTSIDTQLDRGRAYAISQGWTLDRIFIDGGESGKIYRPNPFSGDGKLHPRESG